MIIIDAYNLQCSGAAERFFGAKPSIRQICRWLSEFVYDEVVLVLDGNKKPSEPQPDEFVHVKLKYSGRHAEADEAILRLLDFRQSVQGTEVVSNDKKVRRYARDARARPIKCEEFIRKFSAKRCRHAAGQLADEPLEKTSGLAGSGAADVWLNAFGLGESKQPPPGKRKPVGKASRDKTTAKRILANPEEVNMEQIFRGL